MSREFRRLAVSIMSVAFAGVLYVAAPASANAPCDFCSYQCEFLEVEENDSDCEFMCELPHAHCDATEHYCDGGGYWMQKVFCYEEPQH